MGPRTGLRFCVQILESKFKALWTNDQQFVPTFTEEINHARTLLVRHAVPLFGRDTED